VEVPRAKKKGKTASAIGKKKAAKDMATWAQVHNDQSQAISQGTPLSGQPAQTMANMNDFKFEITNTNFQTKKKEPPAPKPAPKPAQAAPAAAAAAPQQWICYICNRKFASKEALTKHENLSDLHKKNVALATMKAREGK